MSSRNAKKNVSATKSTNTNTVVTRKKSAQQNKQLRAKNKKVVKPVVDKELPKPETKLETKSTKTCTATCVEDTPLKTKVKHLVQLVEQVEYYPDKLKRAMYAKKVFLKPKPNFKVIAVANKRKLSVPQKGGVKSTSASKTCNRSSKSTKSDSSSEVSIVEMVRLIEENHTLSDEDFMEILTCPSPVWWEDPPDHRYLEDAIYTRSPSPSPSSAVDETADDESKREDEQRNGTNTPINNNSFVDFESVIEQFKISPTDKLNKKKQKLENVLGNIKYGKNNSPKNKNNNSENNKKVNIIKDESKKKCSATDEDDSDLIFNEEEVLKNLENMDIPIEIKKEKDSHTHKNVQDIKSLNRDKNNVPHKLPPLKRKPDLNINNDKIKQEDSDNLEYNLDMSHSNFHFISDTDIHLVESNSKLNNNKKMKIVNISSTLGDSSSIIDVDGTDFKDYGIKSNISSPGFCENDFVQKRVNDLSEYITVYKIVSNDSEKNEINCETSNKSPENSTNKVDNVRGKLNNFFKTRKSGTRLKKSDVTITPVPMTDIKHLKKEKENSDVQTNGDSEENRLKPCDYCKTENGSKNFSCDKCEKAPIFACASCNFLADTKELYKNHVSKCKDVSRITWQNNLITNQT